MENIKAMKKLFMLYIVNHNGGATFKLVYAENEKQVIKFAVENYDNAKCNFRVEEVIDLTQINGKAE